MMSGTFAFRSHHSYVSEEEDFANFQVEEEDEPPELGQELPYVDDYIEEDEQDDQLDVDSVPPLLSSSSSSGIISSADLSAGDLSFSMTPPNPTKSHTSKATFESRDNNLSDSPASTSGSPPDTPLKPQKMTRSNSYLALGAEIIRSPSPLSANSHAFAIHCQWNERFQRAVEACCSQSHSLSPWKDLFLLIEDFHRSAMATARTIIDEIALSPSRRTIHPVTTPGIAGGEKYVKDGIFFKFARDTMGIYGGNEYSAKAAGCELRGLYVFFQEICEEFQRTQLHASSGAAAIHVPLMCTIDYKGYRIIASCTLPITRDTIIYGSDDGGVTIHGGFPESWLADRSGEGFDDPVFNATMLRIAQRINIKPHAVRPRPLSTCRHRKRPPAVVLHAPTDLEGHRGLDGRYYVLDTARVMPPTAPPPVITGILIRRDASMAEVELSKADFEADIVLILSNPQPAAGVDTPHVPRPHSPKRGQPTRPIVDSGVVRRVVLEDGALLYYWWERGRAEGWPAAMVDGLVPLKSTVRVRYADGSEKIQTVVAVETDGLRVTAPASSLNAAVSSPTSTSALAAAANTEFILFSSGRLLPTSTLRDRFLNHNATRLARSAWSGSGGVDTVDIWGDAVLVKGLKGHAFYCLFRPEFVREYDQPLSPDAFSVFGAIGSRVHNDEVDEATGYLEDYKVPEFASELDKKHILVVDTAQLKREMHARGINMRLLGLLRKYSKDQRVRRLLLRAMVTRVAKNMLRSRLRSALLAATENAAGAINTGADGEYLIRKVICDFFNTLLGLSYDPQYRFWSCELRVYLLLKYGHYALSQDELSTFSNATSSASPSSSSPVSTTTTTASTTTITTTTTMRRSTSSSSRLKRSASVAVTWTPMSEGLLPYPLFAALSNAAGVKWRHVTPRRLVELVATSAQLLPSDIAGLEGKIKSFWGHTDELRGRLRDVAMTSASNTTANWHDSVSVDTVCAQTMHNYEKYHQMIAEVFTPDSVDTAISYYRMADQCACEHAKNCMFDDGPSASDMCAEKVYRYIARGRETLQRLQSVPLETLVMCHRLHASALHALGGSDNLSQSLCIYATAVQILLSVYGFRFDIYRELFERHGMGYVGTPASGSWSQMPASPTRAGASGTAASLHSTMRPMLRRRAMIRGEDGHPLAVLLVNQMLRILSSAECQAQYICQRQVRQLSELFVVLWTSFPFPPSRIDRRRVFGADIPIGFVELTNPPQQHTVTGGSTMPDQSEFDEFGQQVRPEQPTIRVTRTSDMLSPPSSYTTLGIPAPAEDAEQNMLSAEEVAKMLGEPKEYAEAMLIRAHRLRSNHQPVDESNEQEDGDLVQEEEEKEEQVQQSWFHTLRPETRQPSQAGMSTSPIASIADRRPSQMDWDAKLQDEVRKQEVGQMAQEWLLRVDSFNAPGDIWVCPTEFPIQEHSNIDLDECIPLFPWQLQK